MTYQSEGKLSHEFYMQQALELARQGLYTTSPNPRVGCVIVKDGKVIGTGWHQKAGTPHAEVHALEEAGTQTKGATAYVTLEPCNHQGRTPPCSEALIKAGVSCVVGAMQDPNPQVAGSGFQRLKEAGIKVIQACLEEEALALNPGFIKRMTQGRPLVRAKLAMSLDGRTAMQSGESKWITGADARKDVQTLRARSCAILTGANSVLMDNPSMNVRFDEVELDVAPELERQPLRIIIDSQERLTGREKLFSIPGDILIAGTDERRKLIQRETELGKLSYWHDQGHASSKSKVNLTALLAYLGDNECNELLVETGAELVGAFVQAGLLDELVVYCAPTLLGSQARPLVSLPLEQMSQQIRWKWQDVSMLGQDLRLTLVPNPTQAHPKPTHKEKAGITQAFLEEHGFWK